MDPNTKKALLGAGVAVLVIKLWRYDRGFEICGKFWSGGGIVEVELLCKP